VANKQREGLIKNVLGPLKIHYESMRKHCQCRSEDVDSAVFRIQY
jgi:hypothetical protein